MEQLPALQVVLPLLGAPICLLLRRRAPTRWFAGTVAAATFVIAVALLRQVLSSGPISYALGGWPPPLGIEYRVTVTGAFVQVLVSVVAAVVLLFDSKGGSSRLAEERRYLYYSAYLLCLAGLLGMAITGDLFNVFVFLEISSLASYSLIAMGTSRRSLFAAFSYLIQGTLGATFVLLGIGLLYQQTGTLNFEDLAQRLPPVLDSRSVLIGFAFLVVGLGIKLAVFPLHQWLPNAYSYAPAKISAFLAGTATKVSYYLLLRLIFTVFGVGFVFGSLHLDRALIPLSLLGMFVGSLAAIYQTDLRRLLAYSSIAQIGYMTLGLSLHNMDGLTGGVVHVINHGLTKSGLFLAVAIILYRHGTSSIGALAGAGRAMPLTFAAFVVGGCGLIGVPGTAGFVSKWYLVLGALEHGDLWIAFAILLSSLLALVYVWRVVEVLYFRPAEEALPPFRPAPLAMVVPTWLLLGASVVFGLWTEPTVGVATRAAAELLAGPQGLPGALP